LGLHPCSVLVLFYSSTAAAPAQVLHHGKSSFRVLPSPIFSPLSFAGIPPFAPLALNGYVVLIKINAYLSAQPFSSAVCLLPTTRWRSVLDHSDASDVIISETNDVAVITTLMTLGRSVLCHNHPTITCSQPLFQFEFEHQISCSVHTGPAGAVNRGLTGVGRVKTMMTAQLMVATRLRELKWSLPLDRVMALFPGGD